MKKFFPYLAGAAAASLFLVGLSFAIYLAVGPLMGTPTAPPEHTQEKYVPIFWYNEIQLLEFSRGVDEHLARYRTEVEEVPGLLVSQLYDGPWPAFMLFYAGRGTTLEWGFREDGLVVWRFRSYDNLEQKQKLILSRLGRKAVQLHLQTSLSAEE